MKTWIRYPGTVCAAGKLALISCAAATLSTPQAPPKPIVYQHFPSGTGTNQWTSSPRIFTNKPPAAFRVIPFTNGLITPRQAEKKPLPSPGLYLSSPYTALVLVPKAVDDSFLVPPANNTLEDKCIIQPPLRLEPKE